MLEKQSQIHHHANCLEMLLSILAGADHLDAICPYSELLKLTPVKDDYFNWSSQARPVPVLSENANIVLINQERLI